MDPRTFGIIEMVLIFGGVLVFGFWQLYSLKRYKDKERRAEEGPRQASDDRPD